MILFFNKIGSGMLANAARRMERAAAAAALRGLRLQRCERAHNTGVSACEVVSLAEILQRFGSALVSHVLVRNVELHQQC